MATSTEWLLSAWRLISKGRFDAALRRADDLLRDDPRDIEVLRLRGVALFFLKEYRQALETFDRLLAVNPVDDRAWRQRAITLAEDGHHAQALVDFERSLGLNPNESSTVLEMGKSLLRLNRAEEAVGVFRRAIELDGGVAEGWHQLALALGELGRFISAAEAYRRALARDPRAATIWNNRACLFAREGQRLVSRGAGDKDRRTGLILLRAALRDWDHALELDPLPPDAASNRERALAWLEGAAEPLLRINAPVTGLFGVPASEDGFPGRTASRPPIEKGMPDES
jgi:tetratricopeptide (TPR) repeat protein